VGVGDRRWLMDDGCIVSETSRSSFILVPAQYPGIIKGRAARHFLWMPQQTHITTHEICDDIKQTVDNRNNDEDEYRFRRLGDYISDTVNSNNECHKLVIDYLSVFDKMIGIADDENDVTLPDFIDLGDTPIDIARHLISFQLDRKNITEPFYFSNENIQNCAEACCKHLHDDDEAGLWNFTKGIFLKLFGVVRIRKELVPPSEKVEHTIAVRRGVQQTTPEQSYLLLRFKRIEGAVKSLGRMLYEYSRFHVAKAYDAHDVESIGNKEIQNKIRRDVLSVSLENSLHMDPKDAIQRLYNYVIVKAEEKGYRRYRDGVYVPRMIQLLDDDDTATHPPFVHHHRTSRRRLSHDASDSSSAQEVADEIPPRIVSSCAWVRHQSLQEFMYSICHHEVSIIHWELLNSEGSSAYMKRVVEYFTENVSDDRFPVLEMEKMRHRFSFLDGVYDAKEHKFYPFDGAKARLYHEVHRNDPARLKLVSDKPPDPERIASCKLFEQKLMSGTYKDYTRRCILDGCPLLPEWGPAPQTPEVCNNCHDQGRGCSTAFVKCTSVPHNGITRTWNFWEDGFPTMCDWKRVPSPAIQRIFDSQQFEGDFTTGTVEERTKRLCDHEAVCQTLFMMLGRLLYPLNVYDRWQVVLFIKGTAGSGKSCIGQTVQRWFCPSDVGIMSNNVQPQFALADLYDKFINICYEIKSDFKLNQADFQSMVSGEDLGVNRKNKSVEMVQPWTATTLIIGNESGNWIDASGSIQRRIFTVLFDKTPTSPDPNLSVDLKDQSGMLMLKCNMAFRFLAELWGKHTDLWSRAPAYFRRQQNALKTQTDPVALFLQQIEDGGVKNLKKDPNVYMLFDDFCQALTNFCQGRSIRMGSITQEKCTSAFNNNGVKTENGTKDYNGTRKDGKYVVGIGDPNRTTDCSMHGAMEDYDL
jgi:hypothetical protein